MALQTIPRLELLRALILSRLILRVSRELEKVLKVDGILCLTDSEVVLNWIQRVTNSTNSFSVAMEFNDAAEEE